MFYLFDLANKFKEKIFIDDAIVLQVPTEEGKIGVVAHIVWDKTVDRADWVEHLKELNEEAFCFESEICIVAFAFHDIMIPYSPTTLKKDKNRLSKQKDGYYQVVNNELIKVDLTKFTAEKTGNK